ncbi:hypothetical protein SDC9_171830 [bioreactor metagenome]|uniref:Uncharacterized protein n=1 Tax=bioreactor metagenome TaxID=1076179 RepID=A0A645GC04_9ZZZZ
MQPPVLGDRRDGLPHRHIFALRHHPVLDKSVDGGGHPHAVGGHIRRLRMVGSLRRFVAETGLFKLFGRDNLILDQQFRPLKFLFGRLELYFGSGRWIPFQKISGRYRHDGLAGLDSAPVGKGRTGKRYDPVRRRSDNYLVALRHLDMSAGLDHIAERGRSDLLHFETDHFGLLTGEMDFIRIAG